MKTKLLISILFITLILAACGNKNQNVTSENADSVAKAPVTDNKVMIIAKVYIKPDKVKEFVEAAKEMIEKSNQESGCKFYQLYMNPYDNTKMVFVEEYTNQAAVDAHFAADYFNAFGPKIKDLVASPAEIKIIGVAKEEIKK